MDDKSQDLIDAYNYSSYHSKLVKVSECGCFYCLSMFHGSSITSWIDNKDTALCPNCGIDTVLPTLDNIPANNKTFLKLMYDEWIGRTV